MSKRLDNIKEWGGQLWQSLLSVAKVALQSRRPDKLPEDLRNPKELVILANGPSLNTTVAEHSDFLADKTLLAVNYCVSSPMFTTLRPQLYLIADPFFWMLDANRERLFGGLAEKTTWPLHLFVPARALSDKMWRPLLAKNPNIHVHIYNTTPVEGFPWFANAIYRKGLGVPRPHNVLIPSIATALRMPFEKIYLAGADHSWLPEIRVTDYNEVLMHQKHFYDSKTSRPDSVKQVDLNPARLHTILYHMYVAFKAYFTLRDYATTLGKQIINITPGSFIDAFDRKDLSKGLREGISE